MHKPIGSSASAASLLLALCRATHRVASCIRISRSKIVTGRQLHTQTDPCSNTVTLARIDSLWSHVYDSKRLAVQKPCITVTGTVEDDPRHEPDGDTHFILTLDPAPTGYSRDNNCKPAKHGCNLLIVSHLPQPY